MATRQKGKKQSDSAKVLSGGNAVADVVVFDEDPPNAANISSLEDKVGILKPNVEGREGLFEPDTSANLSAGRNVGPTSPNVNSVDSSTNASSFPVDISAIHPLEGTKSVIDSMSPRGEGRISVKLAIEDGEHEGDVVYSRIDFVEYQTACREYYDTKLSQIREEAFTLEATLLAEKACMLNLIAELTIAKKE